MLTLYVFAVTDDELRDKTIDLSYVPHGFVMTECPAPFLQDYLAVADPETSIDSNHCRFGCCIPCPGQNLVSFFFFCLDYIINFFFLYTCIVL